MKRGLDILVSFFGLLCLSPILLVFLLLIWLLLPPLAGYAVSTGMPIFADRYLIWAMPAALAKGALGYFRIFNGLQPKKTGPAIGEAVVEYVLAARTVAPQGGRIRDLSRPAG